MLIWASLEPTSGSRGHESCEELRDPAVLTAWSWLGRGTPRESCVVGLSVQICGALLGDEVVEFWAHLLLLTPLGY